MRAAYGVALLTASTWSGLSRGESAVVRLLGARHVVQTLAYAVQPAPAVRVAGAVTDALHGLSMVAAAVLLPRQRVLALADSVVAFTFAISTNRSCSNAPRHAANDLQNCMIVAEVGALR